MKNCRCGSPRCLPRERWLAVLRPDGIRSACVGQPLHSRRSALSRDARKLNLKIKFRESFRPFAPAVMRDRVGHYFELEQSSPYMLLVAALLAEGKVVGCTKAGWNSVRVRWATAPFSPIRAFPGCKKVELEDQVSGEFPSFCASRNARPGGPLL